MNVEQRAFVKRLRKDLKKVAPTIYNRCYAPLSDNALLADLIEKAELLDSSRGETLPVDMLGSDGEITDLGTITVPGKPENN